MHLLQRTLPLAFGVLFLSPVGPARASVTLIHDQEVVVQAHEVIEDDLVVWAPYVRIDGVVKGDLVVLGLDVVVEGIIEEDLLVVSRTLYLNGAVNDDLRAASYAIALGDDAQVADDFWSLGYSLQTSPGSRIGGSLTAANRQALLAGQIVEGVLLRAGALEIQGLVGGSVSAVVGGLEGVTHSSLVVDVAVEIPEVADGITVAAGAAVGGDLDHRSQEEARVSPDASIAGQIRHEPWRSAPSGPALAFDHDDLLRESDSAGIERFVVLLLIGGLLALASPRFLAEQIDRIRAEPGNLFGWGIGAGIFVCLLSLILGVSFFILMVVGLTTDLGGLAVTAIGAGTLTQSALWACFLLAAFYLAPVLTAAALGSALIDRVRPSAAARSTGAQTGLAAVGTGAVIYAALRLVPWVGAILGVAAVCIGLGALAAWLRERLGD